MNNNFHRHETQDMSFKTVAAAGIGLLALLAVIALVMVGLFSVIANRQAQSDVLPSMVTPQLPPEPRLDVIPGETLKDQRAAEDRQLNSYGWVDRQKNIVHIPIARAVDLFAQQNQPPQPEGEWF